MSKSKFTKTIKLESPLRATFAGQGREFAAKAGQDGVHINERKISRMIMPEGDVRRDYVDIIAGKKEIKAADPEKARKAAAADDRRRATTTYIKGKT